MADKALMAVLMPVMLALCVLACQGAGARESKIKVDSVVCGMCEKTVKTALGDVEGVHQVAVDMDEKVVTVKYDESKVLLKELEMAIATVGYNANDTKAEPEAYADLPMCCKING